MLLKVLLIIHVISVIVWIGGVTFVTTVVFPMMYRTEGSLEKAMLFQGVEHRFVAQVRWLLAIVGFTGFWLLFTTYDIGILVRFEGLGIVIMFLAWAVYVTVYLSERKIFARMFPDPSKVDMDKSLRMINAMHWGLLSISYSGVAAGIWLGHR